MSKLPEFLQPCFPSYDLDKLSMETDKKLIITSILNKGEQKALDWLLKTYSTKEIKNTIKKPARGFWQKSVLKYWLNIFNFRLPEKIFQKAIIQF